MSTQRWALSPGLQFRDWGEALGVAYAPQSCTTHLCDATAMAIFEVIVGDGMSSTERLVAVLAPQFAALPADPEDRALAGPSGMSPEQAVASAVSSLVQQGLLVPVDDAWIQVEH